MWMVKSPEFYDVIVTENLFGDIITDLGAMIQGGMGIAAGGNINPKGVSMFEPIGGSAPKYYRPERDQPARRDLRRRHDARDARRNQGCGRDRPGGHDALASGKIKSLSAGKMGMGTTQVGDLIASLVK